jgi:hypothetical protein
MAKLIGLVGVASAIAVGAGLMFWRKQRSKSWSSKAADTITGAVTNGGKKASDVASGVASAVRSS